MKRAGTVALGLALVLVLWRWWTTASDAKPTPSAVTTTVGKALASAAAIEPATTHAVSAAPPPLAPPVRAALAPASLAAAEDTVRTQVSLLEADRDAELRDTFLPAVRSQLDDDALAFCKQRVRGRLVRPDWEMAEEGVTDAGERIRRVSMFGKSLTGFVEVAPGRWLADSVWCVQGRLP